MANTNIATPSIHWRGPTIDDRQAGEAASNMDRATLMRQYEEARLMLVQLHCAAAPDNAAIDHVIDRLAQLQSDIKATYGLIGNNPIEN